MNPTPAREVLALLNSINFSDVNAFLCEREGRAPQDVAMIEEEYKKFISLRMSRPTEVRAISDKLDP